MKVLCFDLSASSGRFIVLSRHQNAIETEELFRFPNHPYEKDGHLYWDLSAIVAGMKEGLKKSFAAHPDIVSVGIDTFGVDYVRLGEDGKPLSDPFAYRDPRGEKAMNEYLASHSYRDVYHVSGIQRLPFNTLFQFADDVKEGRDVRDVLLLPDYLNYVLTGNKFTERTDASTGAILNDERELSLPLLSSIGFPAESLHPLIEAGTEVGSIQESLAEELGIPMVKVIATASHDTASAVASIDLDPSTCYLSSGTWSLLGCETANPIINKESYEANFTNEFGYRGSNRFLKNIMGLFIIQELYNEWKIVDPELTFASLAKEAEQAAPLPIYVDVDDPIFATPMEMEEKFNRYLELTKQEHGPLTRGEIARIIYESMAFAYRIHFKELCHLTKTEFYRLVVVGGGSKASLLNQFVADALGIEVQTGQSEATVYGNALAQLSSLSPSLSWEDLRKQMIDKGRKTYLPQSDLSARFNQYQQTIARRK